jgi:hypothetical protein
MKASANQPISVEKVIKKENTTTFVSNAIVNLSLMMSPTPCYSETVKPECLKMYVNGMGFRAINQSS